jgi:pyruvate carboxylase
MARDIEFVKPGMTPRQIVSAVRESGSVWLTSTSMRDAGQSDFKNRLRIHDLVTLAPYYDRMGLFSAECHGGARWHVGIMNRREDPFEEIAMLREAMPNVLLQTLVRETSLWGYRPYPENIIRHVVSRMDLDVWRCFSFLNDVRNMRAVAEVVMERGRLFQPGISYTEAPWATDDYYLKVVDEIVSLAGGTDEIILCIKDMAGVGTVNGVGRLVDAIKQRYPDLVIGYHRHVTDGLAIPTYLSAAKAGAHLFDVEEDSLVRFYGHPPVTALTHYFEEMGIAVNVRLDAVAGAVGKVREWSSHYDWAESPFKGYDHAVTTHRMPGGAFPSSFEQAQKGNFLHLMGAILRVMSLYNKIMCYFDVTPGSQITWVTCSGIVNRYAKERGETGVKHIIRLLGKFVEEKQQVLESMEPAEQEELLVLFRGASSDFRNLILGNYGKLPLGWPADWIYRSTFGDAWEEKIKERKETSPLELLADEDMDKMRESLADALGRQPTEEEFILYLMHPKDAVGYIEFREKYGETPLVLPTDVWRHGLRRSGDKVEFDLWGKPYCIELVSIGPSQAGVVHVVMKVNNKTTVHSVQIDKTKVVEVKMAKGSSDVGSPINGTVWRIGNPERGTLRPGDIVHKGEELANIEAMKMENPVLAPFEAQIGSIVATANASVVEGQLLFVLESVQTEETVQGLQQTLE